MDAESSVIEEMLKNTRTIAVVGISDKLDRASFAVAEYLERHYTVIPVNPNFTTWRGKRCYPSLEAIEGSVDMVDVFRRSDQVLPVVEEAVRKGVRYVWLQQGVVNEEAKQLAESHGMKVVMDSCLAVVDRLHRG